MATRRQPHSRLVNSGVSAATLVVAVALAAFLALWWNAPQGDWVSVWQDSYLWHVVRFSFWQAFLSALLCRTRNISPRPRPLSQLSPGDDAASVRNDLDPPGAGCRFGILSVYGRRAGWPRSGNHLVWSGPFRPTACKAFCWPMFLICRWLAVYYSGALENIPGEQRQLAAQLGMRGCHFFRFVEWPWLRRQPRRLPH